MISQDILYLVANHLKPSTPAEYCMYAEVNSEFYRVFTSDLLWGKYNVYNLDSGIYKSFCKAAARDPSSMNAAWSDDGFPSHPHDELDGAVGEDCLYAKLGRIVTLLHPLENDISDKGLLIKSFALLDRQICVGVAPELASDPEVGLAACASHATNLQWLAESLRNDKGIALAAFHKWDHAADMWGYDMFKLLSPRLQEDIDVVHKAIGLAVYKFPQSIQDNDKIIKYAVSRHVATYIGYWVPESAYDALEISFKEMAGDYAVYEIVSPLTRFRNSSDKVQVYIGEKELDDIDWLLRVPRLGVKDPDGWLQAQYAECTKEGPCLGLG